MKTLRPDQIEDLAFIINNERAGLWNDPGTGKTPTVCVWTWWLWSEKKQRTAFVMPKSLLVKNREEILEWTHFKPEEVVILEDVPPEWRLLRTLTMAGADRLRRMSVIDQKMVEVLAFARDGFLVQEGRKFLHKEDKTAKPSAQAIHKARKNGWLDGVTLTDAGAKALEGGINKLVYQFNIPGQKPEKTGGAYIEELIAKGLLEVVPEGRLQPIRLTQLGVDVLNSGVLEKALRLEAKVILMGFDYFSENWEWIVRYNPDVQALAVDEIHKGYSTHESKRTQNFYRAMQHIRRFVPMTGTLINGRLSSAYPTIRVIEPRYYPSFQQFMAEHAELDYWGNLIGWKNHDKLKEIMQRHGVRRSFESVYGAEKKVIIPEHVEMHPRQRELYDEFHAQAMLELEDGYIDGTLPGVATIRARQLMQCPEIFGLDVGGLTGKDQYIFDHLQEYNGRFVLFSCFRPEQERLLQLVQAMGMTCGVINGETNQRGTTDRTSEAFIRGDLQGVIATPECAGFGFNWPFVDMMIFASLDYQDGNFLQAYRRAIRGTREKPLLIYVPKYRDSIDDRICQIIDIKATDAHFVDPTREVFGLNRATGVQNVA